MLLDENSTLTIKQQLFVQEFLIDYNATQAAIRAGYSPDSARMIGSENLTKPDIRAAIRSELEKIRKTKHGEITPERTLAEIAKIAYSDITDVASFRTEETQVGENEDGKPVLGYEAVIQTLPSEFVDGSLIQEISVSDKGRLKVKLHDKTKMLELLAKVQKLLKESVELTGPNGGPIATRLSMVSDEDLDKMLQETESSKEDPQNSPG